MKTILVVEDNALVRELIRSCLAELSVRVRTVKSAEEAVQALRAGGKPDLVLCDVVLPGRSGADLIRHLRAHAVTRHLAVIAVTVLADAGTARKLRAAGFSDVIPKPIDPASFTAQVRRWLN